MRTCPMTAPPLAFALLALSAWPTLAAAAGPAGVYCGELFSGGMTVQAETTFDPVADGRLSGTYRFRDGNETVEGTLRETEAEGPTRFLVWTDRYGSGPLVVTFTADFSAFVGHWGTGGGVPSLPWTGRRCEALTS